jgi:hypothetical protein
MITQQSLFELCFWTSSPLSFCPFGCFGSSRSMMVVCSATLEKARPEQQNSEEICPILEPMPDKVKDQAVLHRH